jgi:hypothetical protein
LNKDIYLFRVVLGLFMPEIHDLSKKNSYMQHIACKILNTICCFNLQNNTKIFVLLILTEFYNIRDIYKRFTKNKIFSDKNPFVSHPRLGKLFATFLAPKVFARTWSPLYWKFWNIVSKVPQREVCHLWPKDWTRKWLNFSTSDSFLLYC